MPNLILNGAYKPILNLRETEQAIQSAPGAAVR